MRFSRPALPVFIAVIAILALGGIGLRAAAIALDAHLVKERVDLRADFATIPTVLGPWQRVGKDAIEDAATLESLGTKQYLTRRYAIDGDPRKGVIALHIAYYTGMIDTVPHIPERCAYASGLRLLGEPRTVDFDIEYPPSDSLDVPVASATGQRFPTIRMTDPATRQLVTVAMPTGDMQYTETRFQNPKEPNFEQMFGYFFVANGGATPSTLGVRSLAFRLSDRYAYYCKVQVQAVYPVGDQPASERFQRDSTEFVKLLMPYLMRCLPDWPAVESGQHAPNASASS